ncbi:hypothetical protein BH11ARM1_BH11ARM1_16730 [soil metagenome]
MLKFLLLLSLAIAGLWGGYLIAGLHEPAYGILSGCVMASTFWIGTEAFNIALFRGEVPVRLKRFESEATVTEGLFAAGPDAAWFALPSLFMMLNGQAQQWVAGATILGLLSARALLSKLPMFQRYGTWTISKTTLSLRKGGNYFLPLAALASVDEFQDRVEFKRRDGLAIRHSAGGLSKRGNEAEDF